MCFVTFVYLEQMQEKESTVQLSLNYLQQQMCSIHRHLVELSTRILHKVEQCLTDIFSHVNLIAMSPCFNVHYAYARIDQTEVHVSTVYDLNGIVDHFAP